MTLPLDSLYRDIILDHYRLPRGVAELDRVDVETEGSNPSCGDELHLALKVKDGVITDAQVKTTGCAISVASSSMLAETVVGMTLERAEKFGETIREMMRGEDPPEDFELGDLDSLKGVRKFPVRVKCALLSWVALLDAIKRYREGAESDKVSVTTED